MPLPTYKPTRDSRMGKFLSRRVCSVIVGFLHLMLSIWAAIRIATGDTPIKGKRGTTAVSVLECLASAIFYILLLIGLYKNKKCFVKTYLIYSVVYLILAVLGYFVVLFTPSMSLGVKGFFLFLLDLLLYLLFLFVVYTYYILTYCSPDTTPDNQI